MTANDHENLERKLNHVLDMGHRIIELYRHITCTERAALLLAMTAAVRQASANMQNVAALLRKNLLDPFRIDYTDYAHQVEELLKLWQEGLSGAPMVHNIDKQSRPITIPNDIALKEDMLYDLSVRNPEGGFDFFDARVGLMKNAPLMCEAIETGLEHLGKTLREIVTDYQSLKANTHEQDTRLKQLEQQYEESMWEIDRERLLSETKEYIVLCNRSNSKDTFELFLQRKEREATDPHDNKVLAELNECYLAGQRPAGFIVEHRDKLSIEDLAKHFCFVRCHRMIAQHIERFDLVGAPDKEYKDLFVNRAAQELVLLLEPTINRCVDFRHNYQYAALIMAMQDLGLVYCDRSNGIQMKDFLNVSYLKNAEPIKDQKTLTEWTGKLLQKSFGKMDERNLQGNFTQKDFGKLKDYYWLCLSIINKVVQVDLKKMHFATYLYKEHEKTPSITDYRNPAGESVMERMAVLKDSISSEKCVASH